MPKVSVIIPAYNPGEYIFNCFYSILSQTFKDFEIVLIDDCSHENYTAVYDQLVALDSRVHYFRMSKNSGGGGARNLGLEKCTGDYIAFCDSDDIWPLDKLKLQYEYMVHDRLAMTHTDMIRVDDTKETLVKSSNMIDLKGFLRNTDIYCSSVMIRSDLAKCSKFGTMRARHPFKFWVGILRYQCSIRVPDTYFYYLVRNGSVSSNKRSMLIYTLLAYLKYVPLKYKFSHVFSRFMKYARSK